MRWRRKRLVWSPDPGVLSVVRVLVLLQGGFVLLSTFEVVLMAFSREQSRRWSRPSS